MNEGDAPQDGTEPANPRQRATLGQPEELCVDCLQWVKATDT